MIDLADLRRLMESSYRNNFAEIYEHRPENFLPKVEVVACHLEVKGLLLLLQNSLEKLEPGVWGVPAGKLEKDETLEMGAQRELWEETGVAAPVCFLRTLYIRKPDIDYSYHMFQISLSEFPPISLSTEHDNYKWVSLEDLKKMPLMIGAKEVLQKYNLFKERVLR